MVRKNGNYILTWLVQQNIAYKRQLGIFIQLSFYLSLHIHQILDNANSPNNE